ncbi:MAG: hypothetical protein FWC26_01120, partial [Fibromonadales bacterium]|nr:hypothetical protein [Fibromonadales bacterium]
DNAVPANAESQTPETKVDDDALFGDDPDKVREQLKNVSHDKPLTRQEKKEEKLKERLGNEYAPPTDRVLKKELGLTSADIKKLQEESLKHKETAEDKNASEAERAIAKYKAELSEKEADAKYRQYLEELRTEFSEYQDKNPEFKAQSEFYSSKLNALEHTHDIQRAMMDRPDRIQLMQALYKAFDYTDEKTNVNNWEAFARLKPEQQIEQLNTFLSMTANTAQRRVKPAAPNVPANIPQPGNGIPAASNGKYDMNNADDVREYLASQRRRGLA